MNRALLRTDFREPKPLIYSGPVLLTRYIGKGKLTMGGPYANAQVAMQASDVDVWIGNGDGTYHSQDGRTLIEKPLT